MIPADLISRLQPTSDAALRPVAPSQEISDKLADLVPGQRLMAEVQALLPNGTYRAMMAQRNVTLALPFAAKAGDSLELEVVETDGKLTLAVLSRPQGEVARAGGEAVSATLSRTGQLISDLFGHARDAKGGPAALPLNGNQPIAGAPPGSAQDILPLLKQAITQSGMFYESHQAEWVGGRLEKAALLLEPQGKLSPQGQAATTAQTAGQANTPESPGVHARIQGASDESSAKMSMRTAAGVDENSAKVATNASAAASESAAKTATTVTSPRLVAPETLQIVQQQLDALATQQFAWQGQVWPGQQMRWEIEEDGRRRTQEDEESKGWQTRLQLALPMLGELEAKIRIDGQQIHLDLSAADEGAQNLMRSALLELRKQLDEAGLTLGTVGIGTLAPPAEAALDNTAEAESDGQANA